MRQRGGVQHFEETAATRSPLQASQLTGW